jgi:hypothetical protein
MKRSSSNCLRVSIAIFSPYPAGYAAEKQIMNGHYMFYLCSATL